ncbi:hydroxyacylglutathione hydrolase [Oxynema sp. CENA135]|uniref:hydroxyacylglutathione hydrolase n=1 Tax=Oxynema sp. CENA135 TaxID=984206 RepID=UPI00190C6DC2|nr:hydroxyacylglutathione hydrolase [Oxynema sp. CENA135]MBK4729564.1 hydroxyacylglutathione hydrolase [Oxynema sp. CENA135]
MKIYRLPAFSDNYIFLIHDPQRQSAATIDPGDAGPVLQQLDRLGARLVAIFNTHHHFDHVGGNTILTEAFPQCVVYGGDRDRGRIPGQQVFLNEGDRVEFGDRTAEVFFVPGHTRAHIAYYFPPVAGEDAGNLFCGDTLFAGGCGRLFEGTPAQMLDSLSKLRQLPESTQIWCAHEYTLKNLRFALTVDGDNPHLQRRFEAVKIARDRDRPTIPTSLDVEKRTNPFLRWDDPSLQDSVHTTDPATTFARLRERRDRF